jgi:hypothetical protein
MGFLKISPAYDPGQLTARVEDILAAAGIDAVVVSQPPKTKNRNEYDITLLVAGTLDDGRAYELELRRWFNFHVWSQPHATDADSRIVTRLNATLHVHAEKRHMATWDAHDVLSDIRTCTIGALQYTKDQEIDADAKEVIEYGQQAYKAIRADIDRRAPLLLTTMLARILPRSENIAMLL